MAGKFDIFLVNVRPYLLGLDLLGLDLVDDYFEVQEVTNLRCQDVM